MSDDGLDPSLELQQLASQALQYSTGEHQHQPQLQHQELLDGHATDDVPTLEYSDNNNTLSSPSSTDPDAKFRCPFPTCNRHYRRKDLLKRHLTTLSASPDEHHHDQDVWDHIREAGVMTVYTRPRNLTEDQKKQRRKESNLRHRIKYADQLKEKRNRKRRVEKLLEGKQVGVQTPDWDAEARAAAALDSGVSAMEEVSITTTSLEAIVAATGRVAEGPAADGPKTTRRVARKK
jgi:hypothetical protein